MATVRKKVDNRIRVQIENGVALQHRTLFVVVGDRGRDQVRLYLPVLFRLHLSNINIPPRPDRRLINKRVTVSL